MKTSKPQFLLAAPSSGSGKTTVSRGLMALLTARGMAVQPYKCGPDYIDTKMHGDVCGRPSVNLDTFMASHEHVEQLYLSHAIDADVCVVEGMMGLFDGYRRDRGSSAEVAKLLDLPVVLVVDARSAAYSMKALLSGFLHFDSKVRIVGVIFNKVGSPKHFSLLREVCDELGVECFGCLPKTTALEQESRYLGLDFSRKTDTDMLVSILDEHVDWKRLLDATTCKLEEYSDHGRKNQNQGRVIAVARNAESFSFLYQEHLERLAEMGEVMSFDPEKNEIFPDTTSLLYLPGGYPEKHLEILSKADRTRNAIRSYVGKGGRVLAECGGMMYLCETIAGDGGIFDMVGVLPYHITARKADRKLSLGYRQCLFRGQSLRGHEFHYTHFSDPQPQTLVQVYDARMKPVDSPFVGCGNVLASYTHLYWGEIDIDRLFEDSRHGNPSVTII